MLKCLYTVHLQRILLQIYEYIYKTVFNTALNVLPCPIDFHCKYITIFACFYNPEDE